MAISPIEPFKIENEGEAENYLNDLLAQPQYRSSEEIEHRAKSLISDAGLQKYFITRGQQILGVEAAGLTHEQADFLKKLVSREIIVGGNYDHRRLKPLIDMGYAAAQSASVSDVIYTITAVGRAAAQSL